MVTFYVRINIKMKDDYMTLEWNFIGSSVVDWRTSYHFYHDVLGFATKLNPDHGDWALIGGGWDDYYANIPGITFELFDDGQSANTSRSWGKGQGYRPAIHVRDVETAQTYLQSRGVIFTSEIEERAWGRRIEFIAPETIRLALLETDRATTVNWQRPIIATVEIKAQNIANQVKFYCDVMGLDVALEYKDGIVLRHNETIGSHKPQLIIEAGGEINSNNPDWSHDPVRGHPFFLSFMTKDIDAIQKRLKEQQMVILKDKMTHADWGGTDIHISDPEGNAIQIVQYP